MQIITSLAIGAAVLVLILTAGCAQNAETRPEPQATAPPLQALPCGEVGSVTSRGENDHVAACKDGNRYRVFLNAQGRVVVEKA